MPSNENPLNKTSSNNSLISDVPSQASVAVNAQGASSLTQEETRQILTPFAFEIDKSLFGVALASPTRRAIALLIDLLIIVLLSDMPGELFAVVIAVSLYRVGGKSRAMAQGKTKGFKRRAFLRFIGAFILFVVLLDTLPTLFEQPSSVTPKNIRSTITSDEDFSSADGIAVMGLTAEIFIKTSQSKCLTTNCWQGELMPSIDKLSFLPEASAYEVIENIVEEVKLPDKERAKLKTLFIERYNLSKKKVNINKEEQAEIAMQTGNISSEVNDINALADNLTTEVEKNLEADLNEKKRTNKTVYSIVEWAKGIMNDLGLGFGWSAFYFTAFTALWQGQTLGKKLLGIRVLQLDGTPLSLWDSFGRYGGYGAGIATGLLGFLQIYWDPNRQAIHDKISTTVVINTRKEKLTN